MKIPSRIDIGSRTFSVVKKKLEDCRGQVDNDRQIITIPPYDKQTHRDLIEWTFIHEWLHSSLYAIGQNRLSMKEDFVDALAGEIHKLIKQL